MKKIVRLVSCGILWFVVSGCSGSDQSDMVCTKNNGNTDETISIYAEGETINNIDFELIYKAKNESEAMMAQSLYKEIFKMKENDTAGLVKSDVDRNSNLVSIKLSIDVQNIIRLDIDAIPETSSLTKYKEHLESEGYSCN